MPRGKPRSKTGIVDSLVGDMKKLRQLFQAKENMPELTDVFDREISKSLTKVKTGINGLAPKPKRTKKKPAKKVRKKRAKKSTATPSAGGND
jgi:phage-related protein